MSTLTMVLFLKGKLTSPTGYNDNEIKGSRLKLQNNENDVTYGAENSTKMRGRRTFGISAHASHVRTNEHD